MTKIGEFMKLAETVGVDKNDIPDINYAPSSILESLETHMNGLEDVKGGKKGEGSPTKGSPTNNVSPTSTPAKSSNAVPALQPPPGESAAAAAPAAPEPAEDSLLDLDPLSSSGPSAPSAAPTSWGDLLGSESTGGDAPAAAAAPAATAAPGAELMSGDVMKPTLTPQAGDVDTSMANMASNLTMGTTAAPQVAPPSWGAPMAPAPGAGAPMMPMARPGFPATGPTPGAPMSPGVAQSPRKPPPPRNALDDLNIKDFM